MMEHCSAKKSVEDFTLFFKINNGLVIMKTYGLKTCYYENVKTHGINGKEALTGDW